MSIDKNEAITLKAFINAVFINSKSSSDKNLINSLAVKAINAGFDDFLNLYKIFAVSNTKNKMFDSIKVRTTVLAKINKEKTITPSAIETLKIADLNMTLSDLIKLQKQSKYLAGEDLLENLIKDKSPKNPRVDAIYSLIDDYKKICNSNAPLSTIDIKGYKDKIDITKTEKKDIDTKDYRFVHKTEKNKILTREQMSGLTTHERQQYSYLNVSVTKSVKTQDQKDLEKIYSVFLQFLANNIREDFIEMLDILELDMIDVIEKVLKFNHKEVTNVWQKFAEKLDLKSYYEGLKARDKKHLQKSFNKIQDAIDKSIRPGKSSYSAYADSDFNCVPNAENQKAIVVKDIMMAMTNMDKAGFSLKEIVDSFDIFSQEYKSVWPHEESMADFLFNSLPLKLTKIGKNLDADFSSLKSKWEKMELERALSSENIGLDKKISVKKYKI